MNKSTKGAPVSDFPVKNGKVNSVSAHQQDVFLSGATASFEAIRVIEQLSDNPPDFDDERNIERQKFLHLAHNDLIRSALVNAAGSQDPFIKGFLATIAEYLNTVIAGGIPDMYRWKPYCLMTKEEISLELKEIYEIPHGPIELAPRFISVRSDCHE